MKREIKVVNRPVVDDIVGSGIDEVFERRVPDVVLLTWFVAEDYVLLYGERLGIVLPKGGHRQ